MRIALTLSLVASLGLVACASKTPKAPEAPVATPGKVTESFFGRTKSAVATLSPSATGGATGIVTFSASGSSVDVHVLATGLMPGSVHGFHVHENGNCASADFLSAGGHFNPEHKAHGRQDADHHAGDMPSLLADPNGAIDARFTLNGVALGGTDGFVGHAVILHAGPDDFQTQPTGNSGARLSCGVIAAQ